LQRHPEAVIQHWPARACGMKRPMRHLQKFGLGLQAMTGLVVSRMLRAMPKISRFATRLSHQTGR
jgi:hypothetical protein